ncbi:MAG: phenylalanine--tRNA ligase subunit beta [Firmicutes bacterium]|nr:phenylalanine--tRNA ligase subunit beta [Bacillota bacterium]
MLISYRWLQEYVSIPWDPYELADRLTMAGLEVESVQKFAPELPRVYVGQVQKMKSHPEGDNLSVCTVTLGDSEKRTIICGAPNVAPGQKVAVALPGASLPNGLEIKEAEIRGIVSEGMLCSLAELGLGDDHEGILVLPETAAAGTTLTESLGLDDSILDISIYANRPDCMSMIGIAREVAALTGGEIRLPSTKYTELDSKTGDLTSVVVEDAGKCPRYTAALIRKIQVVPSPLWMQLRLRAAGMRPINSVVDITNYVMLETGQPLHAFDFHKLEEGRIVVRLAKPGESIVTLDGERRRLSSEMLVICDALDPKCIGGIMGGLDSEVTEETSTILLEAANFAASNIRRTSRALGLSSESSIRFEKGIDPQGTIFASRRAAHLLQTLTGAEVFQGRIDFNAVKSKENVVELKIPLVSKLLGVEIPADEIKEILRGLGFAVGGNGDLLRVVVPSYRGDVKIPADVIEEIVRIWGFERIPSTLPVDSSKRGGQSRRLQVSAIIRDTLKGAGLREAMTYSFGSAETNELLLRSQELMLKIQNPISEELAAMRLSLLPGLLNAVSLNANRQQRRAALFEIGAVYLGTLPLTKQPREELRVGITLWGRRNDTNWSLSKDEYDFYDLKGLLELLLPFADDLEWSGGKNSSLHPGRQGSIFRQGKEIAYYGELHPAVLRNFKIPGRAYGAEIRLEKILELWERTPQYTSIPRYPAVERDLAVVVKKDQSVGELSSELHRAGRPLLQEVTVFDVYQGKPIPEDKKGVAFSLRFQGDRTLVDEEVNQALKKCRKALESRFKAEIR